MDIINVMMIYFMLLALQWQQRVSYEITAYLDTLAHSLKATEYLTYYNNSPSEHDTLYIHLYANAYRDENTIFAQELRNFGNYDYAKIKKSDRGYIDIESVMNEDDSLGFEIEETILIVPLQKTLTSGDSITLAINFFLKIPKQFSRLGYQYDHYEMVQWYPKICVYDEAGWHRDTYHAIGEFYGEYGTYDVEIDLPGGYVVAATGKRIDPEDCEFLDSLIMFGRKIDVPGRKTVRFRAENVHDFAWVCDPNYLVERYEIDGINVDIFYQEASKRQWKNAGQYAIDAVSRFNQWFGVYPYRNLSVVDGFYAGGMEYPNLVIIGPGEHWLTRLHEIVIVHEIGHQWFYGILGSNEVDEAWLDEGFTTYAEIRYIEDKYGKRNSLIKLPLVPPLTRRYFHKLIYYITQTNDLEKPVLTSAYEFLDMPIAYANSAYSKPALFLLHLEGVLGKEQFDRILKRYFQEYEFRHPKSEDFIRVCEEESGMNLSPLFSQFLNSTAFCDWAVGKVRENTVEIENKGGLLTPVDVFIKAEHGANVFRIDASEKIHTIALPKESGKIRKVIIDPHGYSFESNYWNNYYPRRIKIKPIFDFPSLDAYQIIFLPYVWYGTYDGIQLGTYFFGAEFADFGFIKGRHQWTLGIVRGLKSEKWYAGFNYQTPIIFRKKLRTRILLRSSNANDEYKFGFGLGNHFGVPLSNTPNLEMKNLISYYDLKSYRSVDSIDWDLGRNIISENHLKYKSANWNVDVGLSFTNELMGSEWNYVKTTLEVEKEIEVIIPFNMRFFAGKIFGNAPRQDLLFLSGALRISILADLLFGQKGYFSPQEHIHIPGDGNMRGYQTLHIKSDEVYCLNLESPSRFPVRIFADFGYYGEYAYDVGARLVLGPVSFNCPLYIRSDQPWELRWSIGF
jgi:hypothetical protein